jgi:hypothetical protein
VTPGGHSVHLQQSCVASRASAAFRNTDLHEVSQTAGKEFTLRRISSSRQTEQGRLKNISAPPTETQTGQRGKDAAPRLPINTGASAAS